MANIFELPSEFPPEEIFETLLTQENITIEKVISKGQTTPPGNWYDQEQNEWLILLQGEAELSYENNFRIRLNAGDYLFIPAHQKHRVEYTSWEPVCIWLTIFF